MYERTRIFECDIPQSSPYLTGAQSLSIQVVVVVVVVVVVGGGVVATVLGLLSQYVP